MKNKLKTAGVALLFATAALSAIAAPVTLSSGDSTTIYMNAIGGDPVQLVPGLTSTLAMSGFQFVNGTGDHSGQTLISFDFTLSNTSSSPVMASRISAFGFDTTPAIVITTDNSISGALFDTIKYDVNFPNQSQHVEFCFTNQTCPGGGGTGVDMGQSTSGTISLYFNGSNLSSLRFDETYVRYQSVTCSAGTNCPASATGSSTDQVPEPSSYAMIGTSLIGLVAFLKRRKLA